MVLDLEMNGMQRIDEKNQVAWMPGPYICRFLAGFIPVSTKAASLRRQELPITEDNSKFDGGF
jgi:hypothetical protein